MKILIIDHETIFRDELCEWLGHEGYETFGASDGLIGVSEAFRLKPDLIICEFFEPNMDSLKILVELYANSKRVDTPLIFLTVYSTADEIKGGNTSDIVKFIPRSSSHLELLEMIHMVLLKRH